MRTPRNLWGGLGNNMFQMAYIYTRARDGKIPDIYVQDYKNFHKYKEEIKKWYGTNLWPSDFVSLHIRRGDYVNNSYYIDLTQTDYYQKAIEEFPNAKFLVFCADRQLGSNDELDQDWAMNFLTSFLPKERVALYNGTDEIDDFNRMAGCKAHIIANSSFSFMAAYVSGNPTVAPSKWFSDGRTIPLLEEWKII